MSPQRPHQNRWKILAVMSLSLVIIGLDNTVMNVALPSIQEDLGVSGSTLQWIVDAYMLVFAGLLLAAGNLGDRHGRKRALQSGLVLFGLASVAGAFAATGGQLIAARAAMGIGGALIMPSTLSIIMDVFPQEERGKAMSIWAAMAAVGVGLGPLIGGALIEFSSWPAMFWINVPDRRGCARARHAAGAREPRPEPRRARYARRAAVDHRPRLVRLGGHRGARARLDGRARSRRFAAALVLAVLFVRRQRTHPRSAARPGAVQAARLLARLAGHLGDLLRAVRNDLPDDPVPAARAGQVGDRDGSDDAAARVRSGHRVGPQPQGQPEAGHAAAAVRGNDLVALVIGSVALWQPDTPVWVIALFFFVLPLGMGNVMAPGTEAVMSAVPVGEGGRRLGDERRQPSGGRGARRGRDRLGVELGLLVQGRVRDRRPAPRGGGRGDGLGRRSGGVAAHLPAGAGDALTAAASGAFTDALGLALLVGSGVAAGGRRARQALPAGHAQLGGAAAAEQAARGRSGGSGPPSSSIPAAHDRAQEHDAYRSGPAAAREESYAWLEEEDSPPAR